jgi:hypothetical protein
MKELLGNFAGKPRGIAAGGTGTATAPVERGGNAADPATGHAEPDPAPEGMREPTPVATMAQSGHRITTS